MGKMVTHSIRVKGIVYGTMHVTCSEDEHHPEKLGDDVDWYWDSVEVVEVVDSEIIDGWEEPDEEEEEQSTENGGVK